MEAAHRTRLADGLVGIREKKRTTLGEFITNRFEPWARGKFEHAHTKTWGSWYQPSIRALENYPALCKRILPEITSEHIADFTAYLRGKKLEVSSVNSRLRVLRRMFHVAVEWGEIDKAPKIKLLSGERHRDTVLSQEDEAKYLADASPLLADIATVLGIPGCVQRNAFASAGKM